MYRSPDTIIHRRPHTVNAGSEARPVLFLSHLCLLYSCLRNSGMRRGGDSAHPSSCAGFVRVGGGVGRGRGRQPPVPRRIGTLIGRASQSPEASWTICSSAIAVPFAAGAGVPTQSTSAKSSDCWGSSPRRNESVSRAHTSNRSSTTRCQRRARTPSTHHGSSTRPRCSAPESSPSRAHQ